MGGYYAPVPMDERDLGVFDLPGTCRPPQLERRLDDVVHGPEVGLGQEPAVSVHGEVLSYLHAPFESERPSLPFRDEAKPFEFKEDGYREAVV